MSKKRKTAILVAVLCIVVIAAFQVTEIVHMFITEENKTILQSTKSNSCKNDLDYVGKGRIIRNGDRNSGQLTFSCNVDWGEEFIPQMLEIFREKEIKVTFFVSGKWAEKNPILLKDMYLAGHEIQSHGYGHKLCSDLEKNSLKEEILKTESAILKVINIKTTIFAPPSGDYNDLTALVCKELGYDLALWSSDTIDWRAGSTSNIIIERVLTKPLSGAIVLMHPKEETVKALPTLIEEIKRQNIEIVPLYKLKPEMKGS